jgi:hypothetical protein
MNCNLVKSQASHDKKRSKVEDSTTDRNWHARAIEKGLELDELLGNKPVTSTFDTVREHLRNCSRGRFCCPLLLKIGML